MPQESCSPFQLEGMSSLLVSAVAAQALLPALVQSNIPSRVYSIINLAKMKPLDACDAGCKVDEAVVSWLVGKHQV